MWYSSLRFLPRPPNNESLSFWCSYHQDTSTICNRFSFQEQCLFYRALCLRASWANSAVCGFSTVTGTLLLKRNVAVGVFERWHSERDQQSSRGNQTDVPQANLHGYTLAGLVSPAVRDIEDPWELVKWNWNSKSSNWEKQDTKRPNPNTGFKILMFVSWYSLWARTLIKIKLIACVMLLC